MSYYYMLGASSLMKKFPLSGKPTFNTGYKCDSIII